MGYSITKSVVDRVVAILLLFILSPAIITTMLLLGVITQRQPIFVQARVGYCEKIFTLYKLKTMYSPEVLKRLPWLSGVCLLLRKYSIDEVPQLWNVLKGDMSIVGPRPLLVEYLPLYNEKQKKRHQVKPGITGWAQIHGRNAIPWSKRFDLDVWYVNNYSFRLDVQIVVSTLIHLIQPSGVRPEGLSDAEKFKGNSINSKH